MKSIVLYLADFFAKESYKILYFSPDLDKTGQSGNFFYSNSLSDCKKHLSRYLYDLVIFDYDKEKPDEAFSLFTNSTNPIRSLCCSAHDGFDDVLLAYQYGINLFLSKNDLHLPYLVCAVKLLLKNYNRIIISKNIELQKQYEFLQFYAEKIKTDVLITGENGTGKGIVASAIHVLGNYKGEIITQNCAGIPDSLFESEMFGYVAGAFTGASQKGKNGVLEKADRGILFLDEIGDLPLNQQAKLLRAIQRKVILRVGSSKEIKIDVRFLYATNKNLVAEVQNGAFREDFYYRLKGAELHIPPLRKTNEDVEIMTAIFTVRFFKEQYHTSQLPHLILDRDSLEQLKKYSFPGNMRELQKIVYQSLISMLIRQDNRLKMAVPNQAYFISEQHEQPVETFWQIISLLEKKAVKYGGLTDSMKKPVLDHLRTKYNDDRVVISDILGFKDKQSLANEIYRIGKNK
jgi:DNA-binding NtrC family response regulator